MRVYTQILFAMLAVLALSTPALAKKRRAKHAQNSKIKLVRTRIKTAEQALKGSDRVAARRAVAQAAVSLRQLDGRGKGVTELWRKYNSLSLRAYDLKQKGAPLAPLQNRLRAARGKTGTAARSELASIGRALRNHRSHRAAALRATFRSLATVARYERLLGRNPADLRSAGVIIDSAVEAETQLTAQLTRMIQLKGNIGVLLKNSKFRRPSELATEAKKTRDKRAKELNKTATAKDFDASSKAGRAVLGELTRMRLENAYDAALSKVEALAKAEGTSVDTLTWDKVGEKLGGQTQRSLLVAATADSDFFQSREIGLVFLPEGTRETSVTRKIVLDGKTIDAGIRKVQNIFLSKVEFKSHLDAKNLRGVEIHRVAAGKAGKNSTETYSMLWGLGSGMRHQHVHMPFVRSRLQRVSRRAIFMGDHYRRANLFGELRHVLLGKTLAKREVDGVTYFDYLKADMLGSLHSYLSGRSTTVRLKSAAVGWRTMIYRDPETGTTSSALDGYEARAVLAANVNESGPSAQVRETWLNAMQKTLTTGHLGISQTGLERWYQTHVGPTATPSKTKARWTSRIAARFRRKPAATAPKQLANESTVLTELHYNRPYAQLEKTMSPAIRGALSQHSKGASRVKAECEQNYGLKMLVHNWNRDTIWAELPAGQRRAALRQVERAQIDGLRGLQQGKSAADVVTQFIKTSGILEQTARSLGMYDLAPNLTLF